MKLHLNLYCIILLLIAPLYIFAQSNELYTLQKDDSTIKVNFYKKSVEKKELYLKKVEKNKLKDYNDIYDSRLEEIKELFTTKRTVTANEPFEYLNRIAKIIIDANLQLKDIDARIVFSRDWWPNATSLGDGTIIFNAGLFQYLDNEAEIAFVLSHELAHYYLNHSELAIKKYVDTINSTTYQNTLKRIANKEFQRNKELDTLVKALLFNQRKHSRDKETEADYYAFKFLSNTPYSTSAIETALHKLDKMDKLYFLDSVNLRKVFAFKDYPFKEKWIKEETTIFGELTTTKNVDVSEDSLKTHPDCYKRIEVLKDSLKTKKNGFFLVNENLFKKLKKDFKIEITDACFHTNNLSRNLYYNLQLINDSSFKPYAIYSTLKTLLHIYNNQKNHTVGSLLDKESKQYSIDYNLLLRFLERIKLNELASICNAFATEYYSYMSAYPSFINLTKQIPSIKN